MRLDHIYEGASPVSVSQAGLIRLSGPARAIALDVLRVNSLQTGAYVSRFRGRGMEFDESRPYQPGDDPRSIDWRVTARSTTAYTKLFREERERPVLIAVDLRSNMHFATQGCFKSVNASRAAALLSWAAHHRGDRLGGLIFGDTTHRELKPRLGRRRRCDSCTSSRSTRTGNNAKPSRHGADPLAQAMSACGALRGQAASSSSSAISSDFRAQLSPTCRAWRSTMRCWPYFSMIRSSGNCRRRVAIDSCRPRKSSRSIPTPRRRRHDYEQAFEDRLQDLEKFCHRYGVHLMPMSTDDDPVSTLQTALGRRTH